MNGRDDCIACNNDDQVTLWDCACRECTRLQFDARDDDELRTLSQYRRDEWPSTWHIGAWS